MARWIHRLSLVFLALLTGTLSAQSSRQTAAPVVYDGEWTFVRLAYDEIDYRLGCSGGGIGNRTDMPQAENHLRQALDRLTRVKTGDAEFLRPGDPNLMNFPWLYAVEVGHWDLSESDAGNLREYLLRGGFLMVDDFHGTDEWRVFTESMQRVFPDRLIIDISESDPVMNVIYNVDTNTRIPADQNVGPGRTYQCDGYDPHWRGIYDDQERLMVAINFNMDIGDALEHADDPRYPEAMTGAAVRFVVNYVIYSMTH